MNQRSTTHHSSVGKHPDRVPHPALTAGRSGRAEEPSDRQAGGFSRILRKLLLPLAVTVASGAVFVTVLTIAAYQSPDPTALVTPLSIASLGLASLAGGITAGKCHGEGAIPGSLMSGCTLALILCLVGWIGGGESEGLIPWLIRLATVPVHLVGGLMTRPRKKPAGHTAGKHPSHPHGYF